MTGRCFFVYNWQFLKIHRLNNFLEIHRFQFDGRKNLLRGRRRRRLLTRFTHRKHNLRFCSLSPLSTHKLDLSQIGQPAKYMKMEEDGNVRGVASCVHMTCMRVIHLMPLNDQQTAICAHFSLLRRFCLMHWCWMVYNDGRHQFSRKNKYPSANSQCWQITCAPRLPCVCVLNILMRLRLMCEKSRKKIQTVTMWQLPVCLNRLRTLNGSR